MDPVSDNAKMFLNSVDDFFLLIQGLSLETSLSYNVQKISLLPHRRDWNFLGGGVFCKTKKFKEMCEALLEFPEGWGS